MVYLVGAGPGAPGLMTLRGMELLRSCDAVVYDHLASEELLAFLKEGCRRIYVGKQSGHHSMRQEEINELLLSLAKEGLKVVRLKGGDPFVFGRGGEEALCLKEHGVPWELVPGVSSAIAVPELAGIPVTHRAVSRSFHVITGHKMKEDGSLEREMARYAGLEGTLVFLMGFGQLHTIVAGLMAAGKSGVTPSAIIERGTLPGQRVVRAPLSRLEERAREAGLGTPAIIVVGEVADYDMVCEDAFSGLHDRSFKDLRVGMVGTASFQERLKAALYEAGSNPVPLLTLQLISHEQSLKMKAAYDNLESYEWIVFTSPNGVELFFRGFRGHGLDLRALGHVRFAVIGIGTKRKLEEKGFIADYMPEEYCTKALAEGLCETVRSRSSRLLIPRSRDGSPVLTERLRAAGIAFDDISLYELSASCSQTVASGPMDYIVFASASGVRALFESGHPLLEHGWPRSTKALCIGDATAAELEKYGKNADLTARASHIGGLIDAIRKDMSRQ